MKFYQTFLAAASLAVFAAADAGAHSGILLTTLDGGATTGIGAYHGDTNEAEPGVNVFEGVLIAGEGGNDFARDAPGFNGPSALNPLYGATGDLTLGGYTPLEANAAVTFALQTFEFGSGTDDLFYWDGTGAVDFQPATGVAASLSPTNATTDSYGHVHFHPDFALNAGSGTAPDGVYLLSVGVTAGSAATSEPTYIVFLADGSITNELLAEDAHEDIEAGLAFPFFEEAVGYVQGAVVPEPASASLVSVAAVWLFRLRRRLA